MHNIPDREILFAYRSVPQVPDQGFAGHAVLEQINVVIQQRCALTIRRLTHPAEDTDLGAIEGGLNSSIKPAHARFR
jgi:hypothetical protein